MSGGEDCKDSGGSREGLMLACWTGACSLPSQTSNPRHSAISSLVSCDLCTQMLGCQGTFGFTGICIRMLKSVVFKIVGCLEPQTLRSFP